jgi:alkylation response protein AidB-like acyl-CoA dehydrogenase
VDFSFTEEQEAVRDLARQILQDRSDFELVAAIERSDHGIDRELWQSLAEANLLGVAIADEYGGSGFGFAELCLLLEEQGRALSPVPLLASLVMAGLPIAEFGTEAQRGRLLPKLASGEAIFSAALSEAGSSDPTRPQVTARAEGGGFLLEGEKICVPAAEPASRILVPARTGEDQVGVFLLDPGAEGIWLEREVTTNFEPQSSLRLSGARVPGDDVLGDPAHGAAIVRWIEERTLAGLCAIQVGIADEALRRTAEYTSTRKQFDRPIATFQGVALRAADAYIDLEAMRSTMWQAVWHLDTGRLATKEVLAAKWWACRGGQRVVHTAQHLHAGIGSDIDYPIHRFFLWSRQLDLTLGGAGLHQQRLGALLASGGAAADGLEA